ncbi:MULTISPECIES: FecR domain-containing protein [unclassified Arcicella]|uniref:FecR family protein n=1 Tax=unclassified Arcicella TaxID=2644986 RepID=UPI00286368D5|nr:MULTISPECIES: FecR domain-containing protein [unclassified Arcicella]MDR6563413.1 ferric-dicitrate binding protein FerR (iron transport regulator) [Arcicella sp. BE51]MDR6813166.1 ferric-dicitrate binding protein FerR (iron transport regulator) [Arcicella sp. BE140]MDR6824480.1 ferric-dicitrate binding protein FerR (iron transport regulator) [Arcicella sp. BE139]
MINEENIDDLLAKYLAEEADSQEADAVNEWITLSDDNQKTFEHTSIIWEKSALLNTQQVVDVDTAWAKLGIGSDKIKRTADQSDYIKPLPHRSGGSKHPLKGRKSNTINLVFNNFLKIAAVLIFIVGGVLLVKKNTEPDIALLTFQTSNIPTEKVLADGTKVFLNKNSTISFPENFEGDTREVKLTGEAFFEVHHDKAHPFIIHANGANIKVLGTSFNVKAYDAQVQVVVNTGKVQFSKNTQQVILVKGEKAEISKGQETIVKSINVDENILYYKTKSFNFEETSLDEVAQLLSDNFGKTIVFEQDKIKNCKLTATFQQESLDNILTIISETFNLKITKKGDSIVLQGEGCQ